MTEEQNTLGLTKWQLALLVGAPVAVVVVGGAIWYLRSQGEEEEEEEEDEAENDSSTSKDSQSPKAELEISTDHMTPAEKALTAKLKGNKYFKGSKYDQALRCYSEAIELCPEENKGDLATFYQNRAAAYEQLGQFDDVVNESTKALELNTRYTKALMRRARAYEQLDQKQECLQDLTAVCLLEGFNNPDWMIHADRVLKAIGKEKAQQHFKNRKPIMPSPTFIRAYFDSFSQDDLLSDRIRDESVELDSPFLLALDDIKNKKYDNIIVYCIQEIGRGDGPCYAKAVALRGTMYTLTSQLEDAVNDLTEVIKMDDDKADIKLKINCLLKRASLKVQDGQESEAIEDFQKAIFLDPTNSDIYHHRAQINFLSERLNEAKEDFEKCIELNPSFVQAKVQLAYCKYKTAQMVQSPLMAKNAMEEFEKTSNDHPDSSEALSLYAQALQEQGQFEEALEKFDAANEIQSDNPIHLVYKGLLMVQWKQDFNKAIEFLELAIELDKKCDFAYETLATLEVQRGNLQKAIELFDETLLLVRTEGEMAQTFSLREAAKAQKYVTEKMGIKPNMFMG